jgi:AP2-associated kinase
VPATEKKVQSTPVVGAVFAPPAPQQQALPEIIPMRRGRPTATSQAPPLQQKPNVSPMRVTNGDPFAALDSKVSSKSDADELSSRFPTLDQFSLLHDQGAKFDFDTPKSPPTQQQPRDLGQRVAEKLADEVFAVPQAGPTKVAEEPRPKTVAPTAKPVPSPSPPTGPSLPKTLSAPAKSGEMSRAQAIISKHPELQAISSQSPSKYVSTGTMTSTSVAIDNLPVNPVPIYRFPPTDQHRSSSLPRQQELSASVPRVSSALSQSGHARHPSSSRPSLEGGRPNLDLLEPSNQSKSATAIRPRPASTHLEANVDYLRERDWSSKPSASAGQPSPKLPPARSSPKVEPEDETSIESNVEFLRSMEDSDPKKKDKRHSHHAKRSSLNALSGTKNILAGKFGDAFKKFEGGNPPPHSQPPGPRTPSPLRDLERRDLTPITGSEATDGRSDDGQVLEETDDMPPEMRREIERRRLSMEEKRVAAAQAEYKQRLADRSVGATGGSGPMPLPKSIGGVSCAVSIQNRVQSLLGEDSRSQQGVKRTAQGYGTYSDQAFVSSRVDKQLPDIPRKPVGSSGKKPSLPTPGPNSSSSDIPSRQGSVASAPAMAPPTSLPSSTAPRPIPVARPVAPRKPQHLNTLPTGGRSGSPPKAIQPSSASASTSDRILVAADLPGRPVLEMSDRDRDDYVRDFAKRFPSLSSIEMVERDLAAEAEAKGR